MYLNLYLEEKSPKSCQLVQLLMCHKEGVRICVDECVGLIKEVEGDSIPRGCEELSLCIKDGDFLGKGSSALERKIKRGGGKIWLGMGSSVQWYYDFRVIVDLKVVEKNLNEGKNGDMAICLVF